MKKRDKSEDKGMEKGMKMRGKKGLLSVLCIAAVLVALVVGSGAGTIFGGAVPAGNITSENLTDNATQSNETLNPITFNDTSRTNVRGVDSEEMPFTTNENAPNNGSYNIIKSLMDSGTLHSPAQEYVVSGNWAAASITGGGTFDPATEEVTSGTMYIPVEVTGDINASFNYVADFYPALDGWSGTSAEIPGIVTINETDRPATLWLKGDFTSFELTGDLPPTGWSCVLLCPVGDTHGWTTDDSKIVADFGWCGSCSGDVTITPPNVWTVTTGSGNGTWSGVTNECLAGKTGYVGAGTGTVSLSGSPKIANLSYVVTEPGTFILTRYESNPGGTPPKETLDKYIQVDSSIVDPGITWPAELQVYYTDAEVSDAGINESTLKMYKWDGTNWVVVTDSGVNTTGNYVWANLTGFSPYAPMGDGPDLVIIEKGEEWINKTNKTYKVHYVIQNQGNETAPAGHNTTLFVDGVEIEFKPVPVPLAPEETYSDQFDTILTCTPPLDFIVVRADGNNTVNEWNETNNNNTNTVLCPEPPPEVVENCTAQGGTIIAWDKCDNGTGYSVPGQAGGDPHCTCADCCNWYQTAHIHDLNSTIQKSDLIVEYMPGYYDGCSDNVTIETSPDNVSWITVATNSTTSNDTCPSSPYQCWETYTLKIHSVTNFRYVRITIPNCYNDYSAAYACYKEEGIWHNKSGYSNYAPNGMPDFDQKQDNWKNLSTGRWSFCGPTAVANCFWWFDSKYANQSGTPGDGWDNFPLVRDYNETPPLNPGPKWDDHAFDNVNDLATLWPLAGAPPALPAFVLGQQPQPQPIPRWGELIERLAWCMDCDGSRTGILHSGTNVFDMERCIDNWLNDTGLNNTLYEHTVKMPTFEYVEEEVEKSQDVILLLGFWEEQEEGYWKRIGGHYVTVSGVNSNLSKIAFSDPCFDRSNPAANSTWHNNASNVSHDVYNVIPSYSPGGTWKIEDYPISYEVENFQAMNVPTEWEEYQAEYYQGGLIHTEVEYAVVISPKCSIDVNKTVWNSTTGEWVEEINATVNETVRFRCIIHNDGGYNLTNITVTDILSDSLEYADNATVHYPNCTTVSLEPIQISASEYKWNFTGPLEHCKNITIEFNATAVKSGVDVNWQNATAYCEETQTWVYDNDSASVNVTAVANITGTTGEANCSIEPNVTVILYNKTTGDKIVETTSDTNGNYTITAPYSGDYNVNTSKAGFKNESQEISITEAGAYTLNFRGEHGLIPKAPSMGYALECVNHWLYAELQPEECRLSMAKALEVVNAWLY